MNFLCLSDGVDFFVRFFSYSQRINSKCENAEIWLNVTYMSYRYRYPNLLLLIYYTNTFQTYYRLIKPYLCQYKCDVRIRFFFLLILVLCVWVLLLQQIPKGNIFAVCQPKEAEKNVQIFLEKKNAVASRLMYPIWWNDKLKKFACVCMGVFLSLSLFSFNCELWRLILSKQHNWFIDTSFRFKMPHEYQASARTYTHS